MRVAESLPSFATAVVAVLTASACLTGCAGSIVRPSLSPSIPSADALLVLPGFGYGRAGEKALRSLAARWPVKAWILRPHLRHAIRSHRAARSSSDSFARTGWIATSGCTSLRSSPARGRSIRWLNAGAAEPRERHLRSQPVPGARARNRRGQTALSRLGAVRIDRVRRRQDALPAARRARASRWR